jgi:hypothetical protein
MQFSPEDLESLRLASELLNKPSIAMRVASTLGRPIEGLLRALPDKWSRIVSRASSNAIEKAFHVALTSLEDKPGSASSDLAHRVVCGASGTIGGFFGAPALVLELPFSTVIMLRSIADIARSEGEDLTAAEPRLACLEVFALGGLSRGDDEAEAAYYAVRAALAGAMSRTAEHIASRGLSAEGAPAVVRWLASIASRFGVVVSEKAAAEAVPFVGAIGGAAVNLVFIQHFQDMARAHFIIRRLERKYGQEQVRAQLPRMRDHVVS